MDVMFCFWHKLRRVRKPVTLRMHISDVAPATTLFIVCLHGLRIALHRMRCTVLNLLIVSIDIRSLKFTPISFSLSCLSFLDFQMMNDNSEGGWTMLKKFGKDGDLCNCQQRGINSKGFANGGNVR